MGVSNASFRVGEFAATGLADASVDAVLCIDAIQFPDEPALAYEEIRRVLKPDGRVVLTCWEPFDRADERLSPRLRRRTGRRNQPPIRPVHTERSIAWLRAMGRSVFIGSRDP